MEKEHKIIIGLIVVILLMLAAFVGIFANTQLMNKTAPPVNNTTNHTNITKNATNASVEEKVPSDESNNVESSNDKQKVKDTRMAGYDSPKYNNYESTQEENTVSEDSSYSSSSDDGKYLSSDDYYISDDGFIISTDPQYNHW